MADKTVTFYVVFYTDENRVMQVELALSQDEMSEFVDEYILKLLKRGVPDKQIKEHVTVQPIVVDVVDLLGMLEDVVMEKGERDELEA